MNPENNIPKPENSLEELDLDGGSSVDDFIKQLEAKEKDLHITADLTIELEEADFDTDSIPDFVQQDLLTERMNNGTPNRAATPPGLKTKVFELQNEIEALQDKIRSLRADRDEIQEKSDRRLKDFESYKYRMDRERRGAFIDQISNLASQMLPVMDNLDRALDAARGIQAPKSADFQQFYDGIVLVSQQVSEIFAGMGVQPILTVGESFDPNLHEAVATEERDDMPNNTISEEMLKGYRIGNRVIRHSMVKVTTSSEEAKRAYRSRMLEDASQLPDLDPVEDEVSPAKAN